MVFLNFHCSASSSFRGSAWERTVLEAPPPRAATLASASNLGGRLASRSLGAHCVPRRGLGTRAQLARFFFAPFLAGLRLVLAARPLVDALVFALAVVL